MHKITNAHVCCVRMLFGVICPKLGAAAVAAAAATAAATATSHRRDTDVLARASARARFAFAPSFRLFDGAGGGGLETLAPVRYPNRDDPALGYDVCVRA